MSMSSDERKRGQERKIERFRGYLQIATVRDNGLNHDCVKYLLSCCTELGLEAKVVEIIHGFPILYIVLKGEDTSLSALLLNSHYDVVPVVEELWTCPPFGAEIRQNGNIYARGTQDMKCVGMQYLEALHKLTKDNFKHKRSIVAVFVPDEETGGINGMCTLARSELFKSWNVGFTLDEGLANPSNSFFVFNGERSLRVLKFFVTGNAGHGSRFIENSCGEKISKLLQTVYKYRSEQESKLKSGGSCLSLGEVSTCNLTMAKGGVTYNVVPAEFELTVDFRLSTDVEISQFESMVDGWVAESGPGVSWRYYFPDTVMKEHSKTELNPEINVFWKTFLDSCSELSMETQVRIFPAASDSRHLRILGYDCIGFSPMNNTPTLLHDHDEFINKDIYLRGIEIYETIIARLANC